MENLKKIQTIGKVSKIVALVICVVMFVAAGLALSGAVVCACIPESWISVSAQVNGTIELGSSLSGWEQVLDKIGGTGENAWISWNVAGEKVLLSLRSPDFRDIPLTKTAALLLTAGMFQLVLYAVIFLFVSKFAKALEKNASPFSDPCIKYLKVTAYALLGWAVLGKTALRFLGGIFISGFRGGLSVDWGLILISLVFLLLAYIFQYGAKLQKESDETL